MVYRFGTSLYYANASRLLDDVTALVGAGRPAAVDGSGLRGHRRRRLHRGGGPHPGQSNTLRNRDIRFVVSTVLGPVREQLDRYGISAALGPDAYYDTPGEALEAFHAAEGISGQ